MILISKKIIGVIISALLIVFSCTACASTDPQPNEKSDIYRFEDYENDEVFDIERVDLSEEYENICKSYRFTYLSDGLRIKAYISIPLSAEESQEPAKCIMYNRGGNRDFGKLGKNTTASACAMLGRIVVASQYRGGGGSEGKDQMGGDDLHDVIKLIDLCENHFSFVDMDDFCVLGASRGGIMTYMAAREDKRIKRIIAMSAVSDLFQSYEDRDDMKETILETVGCTPEENPAEFEKRSAICWYDEIKIPVLIIHSKQDELVSFKQAEELYEKMKDTTDCTFITYDDDVHGPHAEDADVIKKWLNER